MRIAIGLAVIVAAMPLAACSPTAKQVASWESECAALGAKTQEQMFQCKMRMDQLRRQRIANALAQMSNQPPAPMHPVTCRRMGSYAVQCM